jgi:hypothetical protein
LMVPAWMTVPETLPDAWFATPPDTTDDQQRLGRP